MIESIGNSITDYAKQQRELLASEENRIKSAETSEVSASSNAAAIANSQQQISDTEPVKTRAPQYDTIEISEEGLEMAKRQANNDSAALNSAVPITQLDKNTELARHATEEGANKLDNDNSAVASDEMINVLGQTAMEEEE